MIQPMTYHGTIYFHIFQRYQRPAHFLAYCFHIDGSTLVPTTGLGLTELDSNCSALLSAWSSRLNSPDKHFRHSQILSILHKVFCIQSLPSHRKVAVLLKAVGLAEQNLTIQTVKTYRAAVRNMQISLDLPDLRDQSSLPMLASAMGFNDSHSPLTKYCSYPRINWSKHWMQSWILDTVIYILHGCMQCEQTVDLSERVWLEKLSLDSQQCRRIIHYLPL